MRSSTKFIGATCLSLMAFAATGCGGDTAATGCGKDSAKGTAIKYVTSDVALPSGTMTFGIDIDGNGKADNQLAKITGVIGSQFDLAGPVTKAVKDGDLLIGMAVTAENLTDACASVSASLLKKPANPPKLDGTDTLMVDAGQMTANLFGGIGPAGSTTAGNLSTVLPPKQTADNVQKIQLNIPLAGGILPLAIAGAHVQGTVNANGIMSGQIHGVISKADVDSKVIPAIAQVLTDLINKDPNGSSAKTVIQLFEDMNNPVSKMKCAVAKDCCATNPATCKIIAEEVKGQALIGSFLAPDVQVFDSAGAWKPVAGGTDKNGLSVGLGFTAVKATF